jgi:large subunit ribosomal protein L30e
MSSIDPQLRLALSTGKIQLGSKQAVRDMRRGRAKMAIISVNCPKRYKDAIIEHGKLGNIPVWKHDKDSVDLGMLCGKPYPVSAMVINDPGDSKILDFGKEEEEVEE